MSPGSALLRVLTLAGLAVLAGALAASLGVFEPDFRDRILAWLRPLGVWAPLAFLGIKVLVVALALPAPPVSLLGGLLFGPVWGALANVTGVCLGATGTFFMSRLLGRDAVAPRLGDRLHRLDTGLAANGFAFTLFWRLMPVLPDNMLNYGAGLTSVRFRDYAAGTALGTVPAACVYAYLGSIASDATPTHLLLGLGALGGLALIPLLGRKRLSAPAA